MLIETFTVGRLSTNCYVVNSEQTKEAIIIDPGLDFSSEAKQIFDYINKEQLKIKLIANTHGHSDHISGNAIFQKQYNVPIYIHKYDAAAIERFENGKSPPNVLLENGSSIEFGNESLKVMQTPGHTPGSICLVGERLVFTGDTLFAGGIGRTDFPGGSVGEMKRSLQKLKGLPDNLLVYPGHGPASVMAEEKKFNPFLNDEDSF